MVMDQKGYVYIIANDEVAAKQFAIDNKIPEDKVIVLTKIDDAIQFRTTSVDMYDDLVILGPVTRTMRYLHIAAAQTRTRHLSYVDKQELWRERERREAEDAGQSAEDS